MNPLSPIHPVGGVRPIVPEPEARTDITPSSPAAAVAQTDSVELSQEAVALVGARRAPELQLSPERLRELVTPPERASGPRGPAAGDDTRT